MSTSPTSSPPIKKKSDLGARVLTSVVALPLLLYGIFAAPPICFAAIVLFAAATATWEFLNITLHDHIKTYGWVRWFGVLLSVFLFSFIYFFYWQTSWFIPAFCVVTILPLALYLFTYKEQKDITLLYGSTLAAVLYGTLPISCLAFFQFLGPSHPCWTLMALGLTWGSDTLAYFGGKSFGKNKLSPKVSPNKTIEGAISGLFGSILFAFGLDALFSYLTQGSTTHTELFGQSWLTVTLAWTPLTLPQLLILAIPANIVSQIGDLAESLLKRAHGVKDSGVIVYGHGGILDRIDGVMFATPWVYFCARFLF